MSMRTIRRSIARYRMRECGYERMNKARFKDGPRDRKGEILPGKAVTRSAFGIHWKAFLNPASREYQSWVRVMKRKENNRRKQAALMQAIEDKRAARKIAKGGK